MKVVFGGILHSLPLIGAIMLALMVAALVGLAVTDSCWLDIYWRESIVELQTFLGGASVLAAALFAYHANTAAVRETRRKNEADRAKRKEDVLLKAALNAEMLRGLSHDRLEQISKLSEGYSKPDIHLDDYKGLAFTLPERLYDVWDDLSVLPKEIHHNYAQLTLYARLHVEEFSELIAAHDRKKETISPLVELLFSTIKQQSENVAGSGFETLAGLLKEERRICWKRPAHSLKEINKLALRIISEIPLATLPKYEIAPYPPEIQ